MADRYIPEHRRNFKAKATFKPDELRRRREEQQVEIRKQKREENLAKRRNMAVTSPAPGAGVDSDEEGGTESQVSFFSLSLVFLLFTPRLPREPVPSLFSFPIKLPQYASSWHRDGILHYRGSSHAGSGLSLP